MIQSGNRQELDDKYCFFKYLNVDRIEQIFT